jgi:glucose/arabinose dehydrogenase
VIFLRRNILWPAFSLACALAGCHSDAAGPGDGGTTLPPGLTLKADPFVPTGLSSPVFLAQPLNDGRIFVVEKAGRIRVITNGVLQTTPFLDISTKVLSAATERGLFSVAFHPQYATNHFFYVYYTTQAGGTLAAGDLVIERYTTTANPEVADAATNKLIITVPHSTYDNHNGGLVSFGLDGMLYAGFGDGGSGGDPNGNGQNPNALLGSLVRIDVNGGDPYAIPSGNPYVGQANKRGEIWAKGLRNPWRYTFDAPTGLLYIADVGQNTREEVDVALASQAGLNYGWNVMEGSICYNASSCMRTGFTPPILDYATHVNNTCSVTGGYVYRGSAITAIRGHYFYSDYCAGFLRSFRYQNGVAVDQKDWGLSLGNVASLGVDFAGELYVLSGNSVLRIAQGS